MFDHFFPRAGSDLRVFCTRLAGEKVKAFEARKFEEMMAFSEPGETEVESQTKSGYTLRRLDDGVRAYFAY